MTDDHPAPPPDDITHSNGTLRSEGVEEPAHHRVLLAAIGAWTHAPQLDTPFTLTLEPVDHEWREDLIQRGWETQALTKPQLKVIRGHDSVLWAELEFDRLEEARRCSIAEVAAQLLIELAQAGASALYFDSAMKVMAPTLFTGIDPQDPITLLHLFIDIWGDSEAVITEGMELFALPDIRVTGLSSRSPAAQATAFSAAARMVCEGLLLSGGTHFSASESFPEFISDGVDFVSREGEEPDEEPSPNPNGVLHLYRAPSIG
jgi:hypothetical protein